MQMNRNRVYADFLDVLLQTDRLGIQLDAHKNRQVVGKQGLVSVSGSKTAVMVIPADEALMIALETWRIYQQKRGEQ